MSAGGLAPDREQTLLANGLRHHVVSWGAGPPQVVLMHGFLDQALSWARVGRRLADAGVATTAFDFRGHGETEWVGRGGYYHFPDYIRDVLELLPQLSDAPIHLVGHSMGGSVACMVAALAPEALLSLTVIEGLGPPDMSQESAPDRFLSWFASLERLKHRPSRRVRDLDEALRRLRVQTSALDDELGALLARGGTRPAEDGDGLVWRFDPLHRSVSPLAFDAARFGAFLERIEAKTLAVFGERGLRLGDEAERLAKIRDVRSLELPDVGHMVHWLASDALAQAILTHIEDREH
ncbi:MAG: alpha/beta hydrolase [Deltaproteobacteria bacterium]|nr:alpha/beta hydrolase [Deltaproteobacteria bacterium]